MMEIMISVGAFLFMFSYFKGITGNMIEDSIKMTGHLSIQHPDYRLKERMLSLQVPVNDFSGIRNVLMSDKEGDLDLKSVAGRIKFGGLIDFQGKNEPGLGMAIEPAIEKDILRLEQSIVAGRNFSGDPRETVIGIKLADKLGIQPGDTITVLTRTAFYSMGAENLIVVGIIDLLSASLNRLFYIDLKTGQRLLDMDNQVTEIAIFLDPELEGNVDQVKLELLRRLSGSEYRNEYAVWTWLEISPLKSFLPIINIVYLILIGILGTIAAFGIFNTMLMAVLERTREIGVLTAFGMKSMSVQSLFLSEGLIIGCLGGILGIIVGGYWAYYFETHGLTIGEIAEGLPIPIRQTVYGDLRWWHVIISFALGLVMSLLASILPARKAARLQPNEALRSF